MNANFKKNAKMRIVVFGNAPLDLQTMSDLLKTFATVKQISWQVKSNNNFSKNFPAKALYRLVETCFKTLSLFKEIRQFNADTVLAHYAFHYGLIGTVAAKLARKKCIIQAVGSDLKLDPLISSRRAVVSFALQLSSGTICVSNDLEKVAKSLGARNTIAIPPPLDLTGFQKRSIVRKERQVISVMKLIPVKGIPYLIGAMSHVKESTLLIIGDGPDREKSEELSRRLGLHNRIIFLGWLERKDIWPLLQESSVFVLSSLSEGTPRAILEAMKCGLPIVSTRVGGIPEMIVNNVNGILVPPKDEKALASAIERIMDDQILRKNISSRNEVEAQKYEFSAIRPKVYQYLKNSVL